MKKLLVLFLLPLAVFGQGAVRRVDTLAQLLSLPVNAVSTSGKVTYEVGGYTTLGDGGGGVFYWDPSSTAATNLGLVFKLSSSANGRWFRQDWDGDVRAFGARAGTTNGAAIQAALDASYRTGLKEVVIYGEHFIDRPITNWSGVHIRGRDGAKLTRRFWIPQGDPVTGAFDYTKKWMLFLCGGGTIDGVAIDGGNDQGHTVATFGVNVNPNGWYWMDADGWVNQTQYSDVALADGPWEYGPDGNTALTGDADPLGQPGALATRILNCTFVNSCGSSVKGSEDGSRSVIATGNKFGGYYDHAFYLGGNPTYTNVFLSNIVQNVPALDVVFTGNLISYPGQTRGNTAVKFRNHTYRVLVANNSFYLTNDLALNIDADANSGAAISWGPVGPVVVEGNVGTVKSFLWQADFSETNRSSSLLVANNNIAFQHASSAVPLYVYGVDFDHGTGPSGHTKFVGNTFKTVDPTAQMYMLICADTNSPGEFFFEWKDNTVDGLLQVQPYGKPNILFDGGLVMNLRTPDSGVIPVFFNAATAQPNDLLASGSRPWVFKNLLFYNYGVCFFDNSDVSDNPGSGYNQSLAGHTIELSNIRMYGHPDRNHVLDYRGTSAASYAGANRITLKNNIGGGVASNTNVARLTQTAINEFWTAAPNSEDTAVAKNTSTTFGKSGQSTALAINAGDGASDVGRLLFQTDGVNRWDLRSTATEHSLQLVRRSTNGTSLGTPLWVDMDTGNVGIKDQTNPSYALDVRGEAAVGSGGSENQFLHLRAGAGYRRGLSFETVGSGRWQVVANETAESGGNVGSDLDFIAQDDSGATIGRAMRLTRNIPSAGTPLQIAHGGSLASVNVLTNNGNILYLGSTPPNVTGSIFVNYTNIPSPNFGRDADIIANEVDFYAIGTNVYAVLVRTNAALDRLVAAPSGTFVGVGDFGAGDWAHSSIDIVAGSGISITWPSPKQMSIAATSAGGGSTNGTIVSVDSGSSLAAANFIDTATIDPSVTSTNVQWDVVADSIGLTHLSAAAEAYLLDRTNHTGTQLASTISDFDNAVWTFMSNSLTASNNISFGYDPGSLKLMIAAAAAAGATNSFSVNGTQVIGPNLTNKPNASQWSVSGSNITVSLPDRDFGDITVASGGTTFTIDTSAVTSSKIQDGAVTSNKVAAAQITTDKLADLTVSTAKIADSAITSLKIADSTIISNDIASATITPNKLVNSGVTPGSYTSANITVNDQGLITAASSGSGSGYVIKSATAVDNRNTDAENDLVDIDLPAGTLGTNGDEFRLEIPARFINYQSGGTNGYTWRLYLDGEVTPVLTGVLDDKFGLSSSYRATKWIITFKRLTSTTLAVDVYHYVGATTNSDTVDFVEQALFDESVTITGFSSDLNIRVSCQNTVAHATLGHETWGYTGREF